MAQENEATRVMGAAEAPPVAQTIAAGAPPVDRTMVAGTAPPGMGVGATQMGTTVTCAICRTPNSGLETYCSECGFLLASVPGTMEQPVEEEGEVLELVENTSDAEFRLKPGVNTLGRENCDILLMESTVSRRHAHITVENGLVILMDLGSSNGTQVDGSPIAPNNPIPLASGAAVRLGKAALTLGGSPPAAEATVLDVPAAAAGPAEPASEAASEDQTLLGAPGVVADQTPVDAPDAAAVSSRAEPEAGVSPTVISTPPPAPNLEGAVARLKPTSETGQEIVVSMGTTSIGRRTGNTIVIPDDPYVSGRHVEIIVDNNGCYLVDMGSTNGTVVNGEKLKPSIKQLLLDGDEIGLGQSTYLFETLETAEEETPDAAEGNVAPPEEAEFLPGTGFPETHVAEPPRAEGQP